jgi:hypothetical protein
MKDRTNYGSTAWNWLHYYFVTKQGVYQIQMVSKADQSVPQPNRVGGVDLIRVIGSGAYGDVWLGLDGVNSPVAVKIIDRRTIRAEAASREERAMRLIQDGLTEHPNLVRLRHVGAEGDLFFYSMDLADPEDPELPAPGRKYRPTTLQSLLAPCVPLPVDECVRITLELLAGLEYLHGNGIVHRDMKPGNVLMVGGRWKLADFGLATNDQTEMTTVGTLGYLAPNGPLGRTGDLYAVGKILYGMLTGQSVSEFPSVSKGIARTPERVRFARVLRVVNRACHHQPEHRFAEVEEFRRELTRAADHDRIQRNRRLRWAGAAAVLVAGGVFAGVEASRPKPLGVGSILEHITIGDPIAWQSVIPPLDYKNRFIGLPMRAEVITDATWGIAQGGNGHRYLGFRLVEIVDGWSIADAQAIAEQIGGHLVTLTSETENDWVFENVAKDQRLWQVGYNGQPVWLDAENTSSDGGLTLPDPLSLKARTTRIVPPIGTYPEEHEWERFQAGEIDTLGGVRMLPNNRGPYIGARGDDRGGFEWITGEPWGFTNWVMMEPYGSAKEPGNLSHGVILYGLFVEAPQRRWCPAGASQGKAGLQGVNSFIVEIPNSGRVTVQRP